MAEHHHMQGTLNFHAAAEGFRIEGRRALNGAEELDRAGAPGTEAAYEDAEQLADLSGNEELQIHVYQCFGSFLMRNRQFGSARQRLVKAHQIARHLELDETAAHIEVIIAELEIELVADTAMKAAFNNFKDAAKRGSYSWQDKREAWFRFVADFKRSGDRIAAHGIGSIEDFHDRLEAARRRNGAD